MEHRLLARWDPHVRWFLPDLHRRRALEAPGHDFHLEHLLHHRLAGEVAVDDEALEAPVALRRFRVARAGLQALDDLAARLRAQRGEHRAALARGSPVDRREAGEE